MTEAPSVTTAEITVAAFQLLQTDPLCKVREETIRGQTYRVFENAPANLSTLFAAGAGNGDKPFLYYEDETWSFADTWSRALQCGHVLKTHYGIKPGERVAIAMRNYPEWAVAFMGIVAIGAVVVPLNAWWTRDELDYALSDCGARLVIADGRRAALLAPVKDTLGLTVIVARDAGEAGEADLGALIDGAPEATPATDADPDSDFAIYYTSGSTGKPKGVILTHRGCITTLMSWGFVAKAVKAARGGVSIFGDDPGILLAIPLFHVTGSHAIFLLSFLVGRRIAMMRRWDPAQAVAMINAHQLTNFVGVPSQSYELMEAAGDEAMPSLVDIGSGGAKRPPDHVRRLKSKFPKANPSSGYGLTETNGMGCYISMDDYRQRPDSTGRALPPCCDIKIVGEGGTDLPAGEVGEVWIRSAANFRGYLNLPDETAKALTPDGWFRSGDLGRLDAEGFLYIVDRLKDMIIRGGENISCLEVEARAYDHADIAEAVVFSVPDDVLGERVGLVYRPKADAAVSPEDLRAFMGEALAKFKLPERMWIAPGPLPRLGTAKFDKITIRKIALTHTPHLSV